MMNSQLINELNKTEMEAQRREKKFERTSQEQLQCYIAYVRSHPELLAGKNTPARPRQLQDMWEEVSSNLNALKGPTRTPLKWKESLANWKKQLRSRARRLKADQMRTGGGPKPIDLDAFDSQAIEALGLIAVDGIPAQELGFEDTELGTAYGEVPPLQIVIDEPCSSHPSSSPLCSSNPLSPTSSPTEAIPSRLNNKRVASQELFEVVLKHIRKREEFDERMLGQQQKTNDALAKVGEGLLALAEVLRKP